MSTLTPLQLDILTTNYAEPSKIAPFIPAPQASLTINGETIARRHAKQLRQPAAVSGSPRTCKRLIARNDWSLDAFCSINWDIPVKALETLENSAQVFIIKFAHDCLSARRRMCRIKCAKPTNAAHLCPHCWNQVACCQLSQMFTVA
jgi:hypothetical protein